MMANENFDMDTILKCSGKPGRRVAHEERVYSMQKHIGTEEGGVQDGGR